MLDITTVISSKGRLFSTLPLTILSILNQIEKPKYLIIYLDDVPFPDLRGDFTYQNLFSLLSFYGINWKIEVGSCRGQVSNHIRSIKDAETDFIHRLDDDEILENDALEKLVKNINDDVGAVGGLVIQPTFIRQTPPTASNKIEDIFLGQNEQWYLSNKKEAYEVDHLYSSFIYRKSIAEYCQELSPVCHREETILTYEMKRKGYKVLIEPLSRTWHLRNPSGGIRSHNDAENYAKDERIFAKKLKKWKLEPEEDKNSYIVLDNGLGDHYAFKYNLEAYFEKNKDAKQHVFCVCFPQVFQDIQNIKLASIADAITILGDISKQNIYIWMKDNKWNQSIPEAYRRMHQLPQIRKQQNIIRGKGDSIIISPYSFNPTHPKSYPYWVSLIPLLKTLGLKLVQIGNFNEVKLDVDEYLFGLPFKELEKRISECKIWLSVDNFVQHMVNCMSTVITGCVLWGVSDSYNFGYSYNKNILKDRKYLRKDQFDVWKNEIPLHSGIFIDQPRIDEAFESPDKVFEIIKGLL